MVPAMQESKRQWAGNDWKSQPCEGVVSDSRCFRHSETSQASPKREKRLLRRRILDMTLIPTADLKPPRLLLHLLMFARVYFFQVLCSISGSTTPRSTSSSLLYPGFRLQAPAKPKHLPPWPPITWFDWNSVQNIQAIATRRM